VNEYVHNEKGNLVSAFREFSDGLTSFETFSYDATGHKIAENFLRSDGVSGSAKYQFQDDLLLQAEFKKHKGWLNGSAIFHYDQKKKKIGASLLNGNQLIGQIQYEYDSCNNLIKEFWDFGGQWSQVFYYSYIKNDQKNYYSNPFLSPLEGYRICHEKYTFNGETGGPSLYHYDKKGLLFKKEFMRSDGLSTTTTYQYDSNRKLVSSFRSYSNGDSARFEYTYDGCEKLIMRNCIKSDSIVASEYYFYNSEGSLSKAYLRKFDNWLTGTLTFTSDETGRIQEGIFKGEDGFNAILTFEYNAEALISGIKWEFTFGKFQQYWFDYDMVNSN